ncbi:uncharacterized protein LOC143033992 [Oratosquilla oratoria]|uniref:uncharacterized protein LOC143033992 n=1 Tax=Oratosquilla oratoria TaxID=337810 RepID=UPI003F76D981
MTVQCSQLQRSQYPVVLGKTCDKGGSREVSTRSTIESSKDRMALLNIKLWFVVYLLQLFDSSFGSVVTAAPECGARCDTGASKVPDPKNCERFYDCNLIQYIPYSNKCPSGTRFDAEKERCTSDAECHVEEDCKCEIVCNNYRIPDPTDCTKYYDCLPDGSMNSQSCESPTPIFNPESAVCEPGVYCINCNGDVICQPTVREPLSIS